MQSTIARRSLLAGAAATTAAASMPAGIVDNASAAQLLKRMHSMPEGIIADTQISLTADHMDAEIYRLANETAAADAEWRRLSDLVSADWDRIAGPADDEHLSPLSDEAWELRHERMEHGKAHPDYSAHQALETRFNEACCRHCDLEQAMRTEPAKTVEGVLFKLKHLCDDDAWKDESDHVKAPIDQVIADLERIVAGAS